MASDCRCERKEQKGYTVWLTGLSGSGKSTLAFSVAERLVESGRKVDILDGDIIRQHLSKGLGFSKEDRDANVRRIGYVASLVTRHGGIVLVAAISPYRIIRNENRHLIGNFVEVYCSCPLEACERRDVKSLYSKARAALSIGQPMKFTGIDDPYEEPRDPEVVVDSSVETIEESRDKILIRLQELGY